MPSSKTGHSVESAGSAGHPSIYLRQLRLGPAENFVYLIGSQETRKCVVVDPAWDIKAILNQVESDGMELTGALVTHYHPDHCGGHLWGHDIPGIAELIGAKHVPVYVNHLEAPGVQKVTGVSQSDLHLCRSGDEISMGDVVIKTIHTPGHTPGSQCFLVNNCLVSGDTLFISGCGRVDLPGGDSEQLYESLTTKLSKLPKDTVLYPGHDYDEVPFCTLGEATKINPYLQADSLVEWHRLRDR